NPIEIYQSQDGKTQVSVQFDKETVWLSLQQMADIFGRDKSVISRHLRNIYQEGELEREATVAKNATVQIEGAREVVRLKDYLVKGYALNERRLQERGIEFEQVIGLLSQYTGCLSLVGGRKFA
ncbi:TPA: virulence factor, partial [Mannheimia haemolytica]|nr:virulence factor [Mannheimia haemolytica]